MERPRFDWARLLAATAAGGALAVFMAIVLLRHARSTAAVGPTADTLEEAYYDLLGLGIGLFVGSAVAPLVVRRGSPLLAGLIAGVAAYGLIAAPYLFLTSDVGAGETWTFVLAMFLLYFLSFVIVGALLGWGIDRILGRGATPAPLER
jgi:hypothetical protein